MNDESRPIRQRACGVVIRDGHILMVRHVHDGRDYWTLPGGGIDAGESVFAAAEREVLEETGLRVSALQLLCHFEASHSLSQCVLMTTPSASEVPVLGADPEEAHLPDDMKMLREVAFLNIADQHHVLMVQQVMSEMKLLNKVSS